MERRSPSSSEALQSPSSFEALHGHKRKYPLMSAPTPSKNLNQSGWFNLLMLRPYGAENLSPKVKFWIACSSVVILFMAGLEGLVWGLISRYLVPETDASLRITVALFMFFFVFCLIWIADASLILFQPKPSQITSSTENSDSIIPSKTPFSWTFAVGVAFRVGIVSISLYITAPMLSQVIRDSDITKQLDSEGRQIKADFIQAKQDEFTKQIDLLKKQTETANKSADRSVNALAVYNKSQEKLKSDIDSLTDDINKYKAQMELEDSGDRKKGIRAGRGPRYNAAKSRLEALKKLLAKKQIEYKTQPVPPMSSADASIKQFNQQITDLSTTFNAQKTAMEAMDLAEFAETYKHEMTKQFPKNTPGNRINALKKLNEQEAVPHWQSSEGMAQALLGVLFLSLLALKCFEPDEVRLYFNETFQMAWPLYNNGTLEMLPGGERFKNIPKVTYTQFARLYTQYEIDEDTDFENSIADRIENRKDKNIRAEKKVAHLSHLIEKLKEDREHQRNLHLNEINKLKVEFDAYKDKLKFDNSKEVLTEKNQIALREKTLELQAQEQEIFNKKSEIELEKTRLFNEYEERKKRLGEEMSLEHEKLAAIAQNLTNECQEKKIQADHEIDKSKRKFSIETIREVIKEIERSKDAIINDIKNCDKMLEEYKDKVKKLDVKKEQTGQEPIYLQVEIDKITTENKSLVKDLEVLTEEQKGEIRNKIKANGEQIKKLQANLDSLKLNGKQNEHEKESIDLQFLISNLEREKINFQNKLLKEESKLDDWREKLKKLIEW